MCCRLLCLSVDLSVCVCVGVPAGGGRRRRPPPPLTAAVAGPHPRHSMIGLFRLWGIAWAFLVSYGFGLTDTTD